MASVLGFLTGVGSLFAGDKDDKSKTSTNEMKNTTAEQAASSQSTQSQVGTSAQTQTGTQVGTSTQTGSQTSTGTQTSATQGVVKDTQTSQMQGTTSLFDSRVMDTLNQQILGQLGTAPGVASDALTGRLSQVVAQAGQPEFDVNRYVSGIADAATAATQSDLESRINSTLSSVGASETGNSMAALLGNRMRNDASASLAGTISNAYAQGEQIRAAQQESLTQQIGALSGDIGNQLTALLDAAKGGVQATTERGTTTGTQTSSTTGTVKSTDKTTSTATSKDKTTSTAKTKSTEKLKTRASEVGLTQGTSQTKSKTDSKTKKGDLFTNILDKLQTSNLAA